MRVSGAGSGGWRIAENGTQSIVTTNVDVLSTGKAWSQNGPNADYRAIASSADGTRLIAAGYGSPLAISPDGGASWSYVPTGYSNTLTTVASSASGRWLAATLFNGPVLLSSDFGADWSPANFRTGQ